jgi:hypothetical protein
MPNWVTNVLTIDCSNEILEQIRDFIKNDKRVIDFDKIIPMPESLRVSDNSLGSLALHAIYYKPSKASTDADPYGEEDWEDLDKYKESYISDEEVHKRFNKLSEKDKEEATNLAKIYKDNLDNYGSKTWYDWACRNWGTKWNASESSIDNNGDIRFETAWATPHPVIRRLSEIFPTATFTVKFADEDIGNNCGSYQIKNGEDIFFEEGDEDFAYDVKGWSREDWNSDDEN